MEPCKTEYVIIAICKTVINSDRTTSNLALLLNRLRIQEEILSSADQEEHIDGHESKPANSNFSNFFLFDKFEGNTFLHNVLKNLVPSMSLYPSLRQLSKPAISHRDTFQRNKTG